MSRTLAIVFLFALQCATAYGQRPFAEINTEYQYNPFADLKYAHALYDAGDSAVIMLEIIFNNKLGPEDFELLHYSLYEDHQSEKVLFRDSLDLTGDRYTGGDQRSYYWIAVPKGYGAHLLVAETSRRDAAWRYRYGISLDTALNYGNDGLMLWGEDDRPLLRNFVHQDEQLRITTLDDADTTLYAYYYADEFTQALPPMVTEADAPDRGLTVDSTFSMATGTGLVLNRRGMYFVQRDTASLEGIAFRVVDPYYPSLTVMDEIIEPLLYISTRDEMQNLRQNPDQQEAFENYWIEQAGTTAKASTMIKKYYEQTEEANFYFTTFKEGWKTDMGMIYIVYGKPDEVYNNRETIEWVYNRNLAMPIIRFSFIKIKNIFSDRHYILLRKKNYDRHWFMSVKMWRDGKK